MFRQALADAIEQSVFSPLRKALTELERMTILESDGEQSLSLMMLMEQIKLHYTRIRFSLTIPPFSQDNASSYIALLHWMTSRVDECHIIGCEDQKTFWLQLFKSLVDPLSQMLSHWLGHADIRDPFNEFFIYQKRYDNC
jgi:hypothetical protein